MVTKGIYLFWDKKYEQVIYAGRFTGKERIKDHFRPSKKHVQKINGYVQNHPNRIESIIFCEFDNISDDDLNQLEMETIALFKLNKYRHPDSHVFNFTDGGEGVSGFIHSEESRKKMSENHADVSGKNNPMYEKKRPEIPGKNSPSEKYILWDVTKCQYFKAKMYRSGNAGINPLSCFGIRYNGKQLPIGYHLDFYTPELINDLINESLEVN